MSNAHKAIKAYESLEQGHTGADGIAHKAYYIRGLREYFEKKSLSALKTLYRGLELTSQYPESPDKKSWRFYILERISYLHIDLGDIDLALRARKEAFEDSIWANHRFEASNNRLDIGLLYKRKKKYDSAKVYFKEALRMYNDTSLLDKDNYDKDVFFINQVTALDALGDIALHQNQKDSAYRNFSKANKIFSDKELINSDLLPGIYKLGPLTSYGYMLFYQNNLNQSEAVLNQVRDSLRKKYSYSRVERDLYVRVCDFMNKVYLKQGAHEKSISTLSELNKYLITYNEKSIAKQLQLYASEFELEEKDESISKLEELTEQQTTIVQQKNVINWVLGGLFLSFLILGVVLFRQNKLNNKYKTAILEQRLLRSQLNPHFLFNALGRIVNLSSGNSEKVIPYTLKLSGLLRSILENSREEFVFLEEEIQTINDYLELQSNFSQRFNYVVYIDKDVDVENIMIPPMFIQPFVENAIEHGISNVKDGNISISISKQDKGKLIKCSIVDNGLGYSNAEKVKTLKSDYESISGSILRERFKIYSKSLKVNSRFEITEENGTKVDVFLPFILE
ncbi:tetratricopeptide repeat-containing sensor histidine kinase [Aquimarina gracilis]|uniref:tetratricopeptide repeat-containing sensor histidine kinase n=1 Tax=Aquimarina gracilis TaxID=874422 RepID=UPI002B488F20|nr:histidine kinase [Aquimarina gracilis]